MDWLFVASGLRYRHASLGLCLLFGMLNLAAQERLPARYSVLQRTGDGRVQCHLVDSAVAASRFGLSFVPDEQTSKTRTSPNGQDAARISVTFNGFPADAQVAFQFAVDLMAEGLNINTEVRVKANWIPLEEGTLGGAGGPFVSPNFPGNPEPNASSIMALADQLAGFDLFPDEFDIDASFNSDDPDWYFGTDASPADDQIDFVSVVLHELVHGLGFVDSFDSGDSWGLNFSTGTSPVLFDTFVQNEAGTSLIDTSIFPNPSAELADALTSPLFFAGGPAVLANGGTRPPLFAPLPFEMGSSVAHWDSAAFPPGDPNYLMTPSSRLGIATHSPGPLTWSVLGDFGWTFSSVFTLHFAQFGNGKGLTSDVVVFNPSGSVHADGEVRFFDPDGLDIDPAPFLPEGAEFSLPPLGTRTFATNGSGALVSGSAVVTSDFPVAGLIRFALSAGVAAVTSSQPLKAVILPVRRLDTLNTGVAVRNAGEAAIIVDLTLKDEDGGVVSNGMAQRTIPPRGQIAQFINEIFPLAQTADFSGSICISAQSERIAVIGLELDTGINPTFTTLPVNPLSGSRSAGG